ncbi:hypothetical protein SRB5_46650 [Streptomyces sp. RB5]|uniref:Alkaline phosphatase-like protein PglZ C-terminal domain-containing protein n=1 Tax=Streptomyces smaragdinus TaxID=2585196 RepID=A0A7K0CLZ0_9ACTN|nr:hypothetical protein [Streptomyces smaragdinus]MQY14497.1 hypothetical protein [Streptomyces smaragdinus]
MSATHDPTPRAVDTPYEKFRASLGGRPTVMQFERWVEEHPTDGDLAQALVDTGWLAARGERRRGGGDPAKALELFTRAAVLGGPAGRQAGIGAVEVLYALGRDQEAGEAEQVLREELAGPGGAAADALEVYDAMVAMLSDIRRSDRALDWCLAGLDHPAAREADPTGDGAAAELSRGLRTSRAFLRRELGLPLTDEDLAAEAEAEAELSAAGEALMAALDGLPPGRRVEVPDDGGPFDGVVLRWVRPDFAAVRARWPRSTDSYGDDYTAYAERLESDARAYADAGVVRVHLVSATDRVREVRRPRVPRRGRSGNPPGVQPAHRGHPPGADVGMAPTTQRPVLVRLGPQVQEVLRRPGEELTVEPSPGRTIRAPVPGGPHRGRADQSRGVQHSLCVTRGATGQLALLPRRQDPDKLRQALAALWESNTLPLTAVAAAAGLPPTRARGYATVLTQLLNTDGIQVLELLPDNKTLRLNLTWLKTQFGLEE